MASAHMVSINQRICNVQTESCKMLLPIEGYDHFPLLSLDISVEPLEEKIPNVSRNAWIAKERTNENPSDNLTQDESASIQLYTMEWKSSNHSLYFHLNETLRAPNRELLTPYFGYLKLILTALWKLPSVKKTVWCGIKADLSSQYPVGKTFVWWGFSLCTDSLTLLESENFLGNIGIRTLFNIECESGKEIHQHSYFQQENEILLLPATQFQVVGKINDAPGVHIVHLKEIKPRFPLLQPPFDLTTTSYKSSTVTTSDTHNNKTSSLPDVPHTTAMESQQLVSNSTKTYHNQNLESLIQKKATLVFAELRKKQLNDEDAQLIADALTENCHWEGLSLAENNIGAASAASLSNALLSNSTLQILRLEDNQLGDDGITHLTSALKVNRTVENLYISSNGISDVGAMQLASMLQINKCLKHLNLQDNQIGHGGITALSTALKVNTTLKDLNLRLNKITNRSVHAILDLLSHTKTLFYLHLSGNQFSANSTVKLRESAKQSHTCLYLE